MNLYFFPAISGSYLSQVPNLPKEMKFWCDESPIGYHKVMLSYGSVLSSKNEIKKDDIRQCDALVFVDSGGLQTFTTGLSVNIHDLIEYQNDMADWALSLDYAPAGVNDSMSTVSLDKIKKYAMMTGENNKIMIDKLNKPLWGILHGNTYEQMEIWYKYALEDYISNFYGIAVSFRPKTNFEAMARQMLFLYEHGIKRVHILGAGNDRAMLIAAGILKKGYFDLISMDTSTNSFSAAYAFLYFNGKYLYVGRKKEGNFMCHCPVCQRFKFLDSKYYDTGWYVKLTLHNLWRLIDFYDYVYNIYNSGDLMEVLKERNLYGYIRYLENIDGWL